MTVPTRALVLFSGGQDSTTCLAWALDRFDTVETVGFDYGQRHRVELHCRQWIRDALQADFPAWGARLGDDHMLQIPVVGEISDTALTRETEISLAENGLPNTFVPGRNLLFLTLAAALAYRRGIRHLIGGMGEADYSGYPDCRDDAIKAMQVALNVGMGSDFVLHTPLMWHDKATVWALTRQLGDEPLVDLILEQTHSCYLGDRDKRHEWGYGCGACPACELRARGYTDFMASLVKE
ncbi:MAG: 7-cyano-7-deazaguanine synthase QueC [Rhodospirillaceae bacterium]|mgnify:CR=1 FL=1|jgi:7-cyano-7-deazaguanine synthase|nr:7-cyano-7-deazaguanine synthase QueC [Rhodospirillaceae bacterium]MBT5459112.1 7-cyano-7-deazaguanine synthase QueC [Rhodospirillaceae bacterium]